MTNIVQDIRKKQNTVFNSLYWYKTQVAELMQPKAKMRNDLRAESTLTSKIQIGKLYLYRYDPKFKAVLPVYDTYPLVFPFNHAQGGFLGINLHYLPFGFRMYIIAKMKPHLVLSKQGEVRRANLSWQILNSIAGVRSLDGAVKHYLTSHIRSSFMQIDYKDWGIACALPVENFVRKP